MFFLQKTIQDQAEIPIGELCLFVVSFASVFAMSKLPQKHVEVIPRFPAGQHERGGAVMNVFHGSTEMSRQPLTHAGSRNLDFGTDFYVNDLRGQAIFWANRPVNNNHPRWQAYDLIEGGIANDPAIPIRTAT